MARNEKKNRRLQYNLGYNSLDLIVVSIFIGENNINPEKII